MGIVAKGIAGVDAMFKTVYGEYATALYGSGKEDPLESIINEKYELVGQELKLAQRVTFGGSTSFGVLPDANNSVTVNPVITAKKAYARVRLNNMTMEQAKEASKTAFANITKDEIDSKIKSFRRTQACALYNDGTGILGQFSGSATGTATNPIAVVLNTGLYGFRASFFEEGDYIQVRQGGTTLLSSEFEITSIDPVTRTLTLTRISGSDNLTTIGAGNHDIVLNKSLNLAPTGLLKVLGFTSGSLYGVGYRTRFSPYILNSTNTPLIGVEYFNKIISQMANRSNQTPDFAVTSYTQYERLLNQGESQKRFMETSMETSKKVGGKTYSMSYDGVAYRSPSGTITILPSRYVRDDMVIVGNKDKLVRYLTSPFKWLDRDGTVLLREQNSDSYEARYGGYYENYLNPFYFGFMTGFSV